MREIELYPKSGVEKFLWAVGSVIAVSFGLLCGIIVMLFSKLAIDSWPGIQFVSWSMLAFLFVCIACVCIIIGGAAAIDVYGALKKKGGNKE